MTARARLIETRAQVAALRAAFRQFETALDRADDPPTHPRLHRQARDYELGIFRGLLVQLWADLEAEPLARPDYHAVVLEPCEWLTTEVKP